MPTPGSQPAPESDALMFDRLIGNAIYQWRTNPSPAFKRRLDLLLARGLDPNRPIAFTQCDEAPRGVAAHDHLLAPLSFAAFWRAWACLEPLLNVCDPNAPDEHGRSPLMVALTRLCDTTADANDLDRVVALLAPCSDLSMVDADGRDALMLACSHAQACAIELLIEKSDLARVDRHGMNALMLALDSSSGHANKANQLRSQISALAARTDIFARDHQGRGLAHLCVDHHDPHVVSLFCRPHLMASRDREGRTPLMAAAASRGSPNIALILEASDPHALDPLGRDSLMISIELGRVDVAKALIPHADLTLADARGERAIHKTQIFEHDELFNILEPLDLAQNEALALRNLLANASPSQKSRL